MNPKSESVAPAVTATITIALQLLLLLLLLLFIPTTASCYCMAIAVAVASTVTISLSREPQGTSNYSPKSVEGLGSLRFGVWGLGLGTLRLRDRFQTHEMDTFLQ